MKSSVSLLLMWGALQVAPHASASPQQLANSAAKATGLPWAYGFSAPAPPEPAAARPAGGAATPAAVAAQGEAGEDTQSLRHVPGSAEAFSLKQVDNTFGPADWFPGDHPKMPAVGTSGSATPAR